MKHKKILVLLVFAILLFVSVYILTSDTDGPETDKDIIYVPRGTMGPLAPGYEYEPNTTEGLNNG